MSRAIRQLRLHVEAAGIPTGKGQIKVNRSLSIRVIYPANHMVGERMDARDPVTEGEAGK
jgi:hypothetical protein